MRPVQLLFILFVFFTKVYSIQKVTIKLEDEDAFYPGDVEDDEGEYEEDFDFDFAFEDYEEFKIGEFHLNPELEEPIDSNVIKLNQTNFDYVIQANEMVLVEFYTPWCGHCREFAPEYEAVASHFNKIGSKIVVAKVDSSKESNLTTINKVEAYPTIKLFRKGRASSLYNGEQNEGAVIKFVNRKLRPASEHLTNYDQVSSFLGEDGYQVLAHLSQNKDELALWTEIAESDYLDDFIVGHITDPKLYQQKAKEGQILILKEDGDPASFSEKLTKNDFQKFITMNGYPLVRKLDQKVWNSAKAADIPMVSVFLYKHQIENKVKEIEEVAKNFVGKVIFGYREDTNLAVSWGSSGNMYPTAFFIKWREEKDPKFYIYNEETGELTGKQLEDFVEKSLHGNYKSHRKSQPIPKVDSGPVRTLVGYNFDEIVYNEEKDVFVNFYAPWCEHCKNFEITWEDLADMFSGVKQAVIAKIDATENTFPEFEIPHYPLLMFFPAHNKEGIIYDKPETDLESLILFIMDKGSYEYNLVHKTVKKKYIPKQERITKQNKEDL